MFFTDEMFKHIAHHANLHIAQQNITKGSIATDKDQIERYIGILLKILLYKHPIIECTGKLIHGIAKYLL